MEEINVEEIMDQIRKEIREKGQNSDMLSFDDMKLSGGEEGPAEFDQKYFKNKIDQINQKFFVADFPFYSGNPAKVFIKKVIRRINMGYVTPILDDQNKYNEILMQAANQLEHYIEKNEKEKQDLKKRIEELEREKS